MNEKNFDNAWTIGNGDEQIKLFKEISAYKRTNKFLVAYDSKESKNYMTVDRIAADSKKYYVFVVKEYTTKLPRPFGTCNHIAKILNKQTEQVYNFRGTISEELFDMFFKIYNTQNGR